ncbi:MAG: ABC-F family ATP-binding cassette domain-containing protein [Bacteroidales bacterium]
MAYLRFNQVVKFFGELQLFSDVSFSVHKGDKIALVANNGTGKSTLLSLINGQDVPFSGTIDIDSDISIGYLEQSPVLVSEKSVFEEVYSAHTDLLRVQEKYYECLNSNNQKDIQKYTDKMDAYNAWDYENEVRRVISVMNLSDEQAQISTLSGGQKKRVALAKLLVQQPDFLILDEPTNHLDIDIIEWLENFLSASGLTLFMITHDRYFLDRVCSTIIELDDGIAYRYEGNYSYFLQKKQERIEIQESEVSKAKNLLSTELEWMRRQPKARGTKAKYRVEAFQSLSQKAQQGTAKKDISISVQSKRLGNKILELHNVSKAYPGIELFSNFSYSCNRGDKIGIIGSNGCGKTTLLRVMTGETEPDTGYVEYGETLEVGFYKQDGLQVPENKRVIEVITDISEYITIHDNLHMTAAQFLEQWLFPRSMHHLQVEKLSGGEKKRLYLMTILMYNPNFLILDEPTNDLDLPTLRILEEYLLNFDGCVLIVSHDRFFIDKVVEHSFVFEHNSIRDFPGNYSLYKKSVEEEKSKEVAAKNAVKNTEQPKSDVTKPKNKKSLTYKERLVLEQLEKDIYDLEEQKSMMEQSLQSGELSQDELVDVSEQIGNLISLLENKEMEWLELSEKAEK